MNLLKKTGLCSLICVFCSGGWIDPDTSISDKYLNSFVDKRSYELVFSDEFEKEGRFFNDGWDPKWTSMNKDDYTNFALQYYKNELATTSNGYLNITTIIEDISYETNDILSTKGKKNTKNYQSAMINGWNKFCFTGGIVEIRAKLPGKHDAGGLWPAMWLLGNMARATYVGSSNNVWPWSYNSCAKGAQSQQRFSACNRVNHYDLHPYQGRGAPEIDMLEAMAGSSETLPNTNVSKPYFSSSLQVAPAMTNYRPNMAERPAKGEWYDHGIEYAENAETDINVFFYGMTLQGGLPSETYMADAISANTKLKQTHYENLHTYRLEWLPGENGYIKWYLDNRFIYGINANALNETGAIIPEEPMYLILNTAISSTWGFPQPCPEGCACDCYDCRKTECACAIPSGMGKNFPASYLIDYVRVYQAVGDDDQIVGCSTPSHPSSRYIKGRIEKYMSKTDNVPLQPLEKGGKICQKDEECGEGTCNKNRCLCKTGYVGPGCLASVGFDDIKWETEQDVILSKFFVPFSLILIVAGLTASLIAVVVYKYYHDKGSRGGWRIGAMGRYAKITEINSNNNTYNRNSQTQALSGGEGDNDHSYQTQELKN